MLPPRDRILVPIDVFDKIVQAGIVVPGLSDWTSPDGTIYFTFTLQQFRELLEHKPTRHPLHPTTLQALRESIIAFR